MVIEFSGDVFVVISLIDMLFVGGLMIICGIGSELSVFVIVEFEVSILNIVVIDSVIFVNLKFCFIFIFFILVGIMLIKYGDGLYEVC